jgi:hypothetical protein
MSRNRRRAAARNSECPIPASRGVAMSHRLVLVSLIVLIGSATPAVGDEKPATKLAVDEKIVAGGGEHDALKVRHLALRGSNFDIGRKLAEIAIERYAAKPPIAPDPLVARAQRQYMKDRYPSFYERMRGAAAAFNLNIDDDGHDFSALGYLLGPMGCSVVFYPPSSTRGGHGVLSRNYDFTVGTLMGTAPPAGTPGATGEPYILELHPDKGHASLAICSYDLLGGVLDGINSAGLTVAVLADDELMQTHDMQATGAAQVGFNEIQILRFLLDTCATVEDAKLALMSATTYYSFLPCHYIVGDREGNSFVWEWSHARNKQYIIAGDGQPQVTTNFMLHKYLATQALPTENSTFGSFNRYRNLLGRISREQGHCTPEFMKTNNRSVACTIPTAPGHAAQRTLWHALYDTQDRSIEADFYLRDEPDPDNPGVPKIIRSDYVKIALNP